MYIISTIFAPYRVCLRHKNLGKRKSRTKSKDDILFKKSCQISILSRYDTVMTLAYFDHNNECGLAIFGISLCVLIFNVFFGPMNRNLPVFYLHNIEKK